MANRIIYHEESLTVNSTTSTANATQCSLTFTPSANNSNLAVFWQALGSATSTTESCQIRLTNGSTVLQSQVQEPKDSTDILWFGGMYIIEAVSNAAPSTLNVEYRSQDTGSVSIQDARISVVELIDTDFWAVDSTESTSSTTADGDDVYNTYVQITPTLTANYSISASCGFIDTNGGVDTWDEGRVLVWDDTNNLPYGYVSNPSGKDINNTRPYWWTGTFANTSANFDLRAEGTDSGTIRIREKAILALNLDEWPTGSSNHVERTASTTLATPVEAISLSFTLNTADKALILASMHNIRDSTASSFLKNFKVNGTYQYTANSTTEMDNSGTAFGSLAESVMGGFMGVVDLTAGVNTLSLDYWGETSAVGTYVRARNITALVANGAFGMSAHTGAGYVDGSSLSVYNGGTWKEVAPYVYTSGAWKSVGAGGQGYLGGYVDATAGDIYTNVFPTTPTPTPSPSPSPSPTPSPGPVCCVVAGTLITMADGRFLEIENIKVGDRVKTMTGLGGLVTDIDTPVLGTERGIMDVTHPSGKVLSISDDHDMWVDILGEQQWGTFNYAQWLREAEFFGDGDCPAIELEKGRGYSFAIDDGWTHTSPEFHIQNDPNEQIYGLHLDEGAGYIANGFVVITSGCTLEEIESFRWS